jgi:hypothetical protein
MYFTSLKRKLRRHSSEKSLDRRSKSWTVSLITSNVFWQEFVANNGEENALAEAYEEKQATFFLSFFLSPAFFSFSPRAPFCLMCVNVRTVLKRTKIIGNLS